MISVTIAIRKICALLEKDIVVKIARVKAPNREKVPLTRQEMETLFDEAQGNPKDYAVLKTLYYSGMRENELINLEIDDLDFDRLQITIKHGKGDRRRVVNITADCAQAIKRWLQVRPKPADGHGKVLFLSAKGMKMSHYHVYRIVVSNAANAGITKKVYPHLMRICHVSHSIEAGLSAREVQAQTGHKDISTLFGYVVHTPERIRASYNKVFEDDSDTTDIPLKAIPQVSNEYYKKLATQKYLSGEIDADTLHTILNTIEERSEDKKLPTNPSYQ